jgi:hypothetical protein
LLHREAQSYENLSWVLLDVFFPKIEIAVVPKEQV